MTVGFVIWSIVSLVLLGIGIWSWKSDRTIGFYAGVNPPEVSDIRKYNRTVALLWFAYAAAFELLGLPLLFLKQNSAGFVWSILGVAVITIALMIVYNRILERYRIRK